MSNIGSRISSTLVLLLGIRILLRSLYNAGRVHDAGKFRSHSSFISRTLVGAKSGRKYSQNIRLGCLQGNQPIKNEKCSILNIRNKSILKKNFLQIFSYEWQKYI